MNMREKLAKYAHDAWSGWMKYLFSKSVINDDGTVTIPKWAVDRWMRQSTTEYDDLQEDEKESDRKEADKMLDIFQKEVLAMKNDKIAEKVTNSVIADRIVSRKQKLMTSQIKKSIPALYSQEKEKDPMVYAKFFNPYGGGTWLATEFDGHDTFFGAVNLHGGWSLGYFSLRELENVDAIINGKSVKGLQGIERDAYFRPMPLSRAKRA